MHTIFDKKSGLLWTLIGVLFSTGVYAQNNTASAVDSLVLAQNLKQISLKNKPSTFATSYTFDPKLNLYFYNVKVGNIDACLLYTSPSPRDRTRSRMPSSA